MKKHFQLTDGAGKVTGYEVIAVARAKKEIFNFDKGSNLVKEATKPAKPAEQKK